MKRILFLIFAIFFLMGCGVEDQEVENKKVYDFWSYRVSDKNITKVYNVKVFENDLIKSAVFNNVAITESYENNNTVNVSNGLVITKHLDYIDNNGTKENRFVSIGDSIKDNCIVHRHYSFYNPMVDIAFEDVLQLKCVTDENTMYLNYSEDFGNIGGVSRDGNFTIFNYYEIQEDYTFDIDKSF